MKRKRYTVEMETGEPKVILAYYGHEADAYYRKRGYPVRRVVPGDYRLKQRAREAQNGGFTVDHQALRDACDLLELKLPVRIRYNSRQGSTLGNYRFMGTYHDIMLKSYHSPEQASSTLWHELCHAMQAERAGSKLEWGKVLMSERGKYRNAPTEIEARAMQRTMADVPLCR